MDTNREKYREVPMTQYIIRRVLGFIPVLLTITLFTFVLMRAIPGGPFDFVGDKSLPPTVVANLEAKYHLDWPMWKQFLSYLVGDDARRRRQFERAHPRRFRPFFALPGAIGQCDCCHHLSLPQPS
jgi:hypothetical protein